MFKRTYFEFLLKIYLFCLNITGFWPFRFNSKINKFQLNRFYLLVPFILIPYTLTVYFLRAETLFNEVKVLFKNVILKIVSNVFVVSNVLNLIFVYGSQCAQYQKIELLTHKVRNFYKNTCDLLPLDDVNYFPYLIKFTFKSLVFSFSVLMYMMLSMSLISPSVTNYIVMPGFLIPIFVNKFYPDIHYGGMLMASFYFDQLNNQLTTVMIIANDSSDVRKASKHLNEPQNRDVIDQLDAISVHYIELIRIVKDFNKIMSLRLVLWLLIGLCNFLIHLFMQYVFVGIPIRYGHSLNLIISASAVFELCLQFSEFWFTTSVCTAVANRIKETEMILSSTYIKVHVKEPFGRSVETFVNCIKHHNLQITGSGLFVIDSSLIFSIVSSITLYLVILIQYELAM